MNLAEIGLYVIFSAVVLTWIVAIVRSPKKVRSMLYVFAAGGIGVLLGALLMASHVLLGG